MRAAIYTLLSIGALVFSWPLLWMLGTSVKADKEIFTSSRSVMPQAPRPVAQSPYVDTRHFAKAEGPRLKELLPVLESHLGSAKFSWPSDLPKDVLVVQCARGAFKRLQDFLPEKDWSLPLEDLKKTALSHVDQAMAADLVAQVRRGILLGKVRARSYDQQEDLLVSAENAATAWTSEGGQASLKPSKEDRQSSAALVYDFAGGPEFSLGQTFKLSFPSDRLYKLRIAYRADDTWHPLSIVVERQGKRLKSEYVTPMADSNWAMITVQEPGPDDVTNKIREWVLLREEGASSISDPKALKVTLSWSQANVFSAWYYKIRRNYLKVFDNMPFWRYVATSAFLVVLNLIGTLLSCSMVAYSFARLKWPGRNAGFALMLATMMIPAQVTMIPFFLIIRHLGWYNTLTPLWACSFFASAFNVFLLHQFFKGIPKDLEDAAKIDGCGPIKTWWLIMMPLVKPSLATIAIFTFMGVWNDFMGPLIYLSDQRLYPLSLGLYAMSVQSSSSMGANASMSLMMAGSTLMILPVVAMFFFAQRYFIQGITMTGLKS